MARRRLALTFDDGYPRHYDFVAPRLEDVGARGTFYVADRQLPRIRDCLDLHRLLDLANRGHEVGWHGLYHQGVHSFNPEQMADQYNVSMGLWAKVGLPRPWSFALPGYHVAHQDFLQEKFGLVRGGLWLAQDQDEERDYGFGDTIAPGQWLQPCFLVPGHDTNILEAFDRLGPNQDGIVSFHAVGQPDGHLAIGADVFLEFLQEAVRQKVELVRVVDLAPNRDRFLDPVPWRTPQAVIESVAEVFRGKVVCDLGCSKGDAMLMIGKHANRVIGVDLDEEKLKIARARGLDVRKLDYLKDPLPLADVYYSWPDDGPNDFPVLLPRIQSIKKQIVIDGDYGFEDEATWVKIFAKRFTAKETKAVEHKDGPKPRQTGRHRIAWFDFS